MVTRTYSFTGRPPRLEAAHTFEVIGEDWRTYAIVAIQSPKTARVTMNHGEQITQFLLVDEDFTELINNRRPAAFEKIADVTVGKPGVAFTGNRFIVFDWRWAQGPNDAERHNELSRFGFTIPADLALQVFEPEDLSASLAASAVSARWIFRRWVDGKLADFHPE